MRAIDSYDRRLIEETLGYPLTEEQWNNYKKWRQYNTYKAQSWLPLIGGYYNNKADQMEYEENVRKLLDKSRNIGYNIFDNPYPISYLKGTIGVAPADSLTFGVNQAILELYNGRSKIVKFVKKSRKR